MQCIRDEGCQDVSALPIEPRHVSTSVVQTWSDILPKEVVTKSESYRNRSLIEGLFEALPCRQAAFVSLERLDWLKKKLAMVKYETYWGILYNVQIQIQIMLLHIFFSSKYNNAVVSSRVWYKIATVARESGRVNAIRRSLTFITSTNTCNTINSHIKTHHNMHNVICNMQCVMYNIQYAISNMQLPVPRLQNPKCGPLHSSELCST